MGVHRNQAERLGSILQEPENDQEKFLSPNREYKVFCDKEV